MLESSFLILYMDTLLSKRHTPEDLASSPSLCMRQDQDFLERHYTRGVLVVGLRHQGLLHHYLLDNELLSLEIECWAMTQELALVEALKLPPKIERGSVPEGKAWLASWHFLDEFMTA